MAFAMPIPLRTDFDAATVRREAQRAKDAGQARRLLALASIYDGATRTEAAKIGGVTLQIVRDWVLKFNDRGPSGLIAGKAPGQTPRLTDDHRAALARMVEDGPIPAVHGVVRWRLVDLCQGMFAEHRVVISTQTMSRELRAMSYRKLTARPNIMRRPPMRSRILKKVSPRVKEIARAKGVDLDAVEIWFADEARIGQKNKIARRWARRGTRPSAPSNQRTASTYIFGAICLLIPTKPPVYNGMIAPRDSWMMPPSCNEMIPPGAPRLLALEVLSRYGGSGQAVLDCLPRARRRLSPVNSMR